MIKKEIDRVKAALDLQEYLGWPSIQDFIKIINGNEIRNVNINVDDIKRAIHLYGIPAPCLKGKMKRRRPLSHDTLDFLQQPLPVEIHEKRVELYVDIFKFGGIHFMLIESSRIKYIDVESVTSQAMASIVPIVQKVIKKYRLRGLEVTSVHIDNQINNDESEQGRQPATIVPYSADEHVSVAERRIRTIKERMRSVLAGLPYKAVPKIMIRGLAKKVKSMLNQFPVRNGGISATISPTEIVEGKRKPDLGMKRINFGQYVEIHNGTDNTISELSKGNVCHE